MRSLLHATFLLSLLFATSLFSSLEDRAEVQIDLKNPTFSGGILTTEEGGVIRTADSRIQARRLQYINRIENNVPVQKIVAEGDLLIQQNGQAFVGQKLEYDLLTHTGKIEQGKTHIHYWFLGGDQIHLHADGSFHIVGASFALGTSNDPLFAIRARDLSVSENKLMTVRNLRFHLARIPFLWLPKIKANLKAIKHPPIKYKVKWDKILGPAISARSRIYSWDTLDLYLRGEYRVGKGGGAALETEFMSEDRSTKCMTRSWGSIHDLSSPIMRDPNEYRLQGELASTSRDQQTHFRVVYDKLSSQKMISEFVSDDFEINTRKSTRLTFEHVADVGVFDLHIEPRLNSWQSLKQELPSFTFGIRPFLLGPSGVFMHNRMNVSYLDYVYAKNLRQFLAEYHALRLESRHFLHRPIHTGPVTWTPEAGIIGVFYNNDLMRQSIGQFVGLYGGSVQTEFSKESLHFNHRITPYAAFQAFSKPTAPLDRVIVFSMKDGFARMSTLKLGMRNDLYLLPAVQPYHLAIDLFTYAFVGNRGALSHFPHLYSAVSFEDPKCSAGLDVVWNMQQRLLNRANIRTKWTISNDIAFSAELRHRSRYDWRKFDHENYIVDVSHSFQELLDSPLSDRRDTLLVQASLRIHPLWVLHLGTHIGWGRTREPIYHSGKVDLYTTALTGWKIRISAQMTADNAKFDAGIELMKY
jgi:hypothetical protein